MVVHSCVPRSVTYRCFGINELPHASTISLGDKRAVSYKGGFGEGTLVLVFVPVEHPNVPSFWLSFRGTIAKTAFLENHPLSTPDISRGSSILKILCVLYI